MSASSLYRARWRAAGLCTNCGSRPHAFLSIRCDKCNATVARNNKRNNGLRTMANIKKKHALLTFSKTPKPTGTTP